MAGRIYGILFLARVHVANGPRTDVAEFDEPCVPNACLMLLQPGDLSLRGRIRSGVYGKRMDVFLFP